MSKDEGLSGLSSRSYFGAVFLTQNDSCDLRMIVNREGFIHDSAFESLRHIVRVGIELSVRERHAASFKRRQKWNEERATSSQTNESPKTLKEAVASNILSASQLAKEARQAAAAGRFDEAESKISKAASKFQTGSDISNRPVSYTHLTLPTKA